MRRYWHEREGSSEYERISGADGEIHEDPYAPANLPQRAEIRSYPSWRYLDHEYLDDSMRGIDDVNHADRRLMERRLSGEHY